MKNLRVALFAFSLALSILRSGGSAEAQCEGGQCRAPVRAVARAIAPRVRVNQVRGLRPLRGVLGLVAARRLGGACLFGRCR